MCLEFRTQLLMLGPTDEFLYDKGIPAGHLNMPNHNPVRFPPTFMLRKRQLAPAALAQARSISEIRWATEAIFAIGKNTELMRDVVKAENRKWLNVTLQWSLGCANLGRHHNPPAPMPGSSDADTTQPEAEADFASDGPFAGLSHGAVALGGLPAIEREVEEAVNMSDAFDWLLNLDSDDEAE